MAHRPVRLTRRQVLSSASRACAALAVPFVVPGSILGMGGAVAPSERIVLGGIGIGPRGQHVLGDMVANADVQFVAICDVREERRQAIKGMADSKYGNVDCATYRNFPELLERRDIDAVLIATGDRWHTLLSTLAARAGKDVYCEKPCSMTIAESRALADTFRRYGRVYQAGTQRRNVPNFIFAAELAHSGKLGRIHTVHANTLDPPVTHDWLPAEPEPPKDVVDWDMWLGPCPWRPYNSAYVRGGWRGFFDFHGGGILEWGSHTVDLCQWASQSDATAPVEYDPQKKGVIAKYANGVKLVMREDGWLGLGTCSARYEGDEGWVEVGDSGKVEVFPESLRSEKPIQSEEGTSPRRHARDFLSCVKSRAQPKANASVACQSHIACHAAYISWQLGRKLTFDPSKDEFVSDEEANRMRSRALREPWRV
ncbi:MAG: Gfo/Idh/MocA family oxidoreductase [Planctomycetes bacterium]|nr:Gfo/Idh/MocA family oxidoreductase [Planctomycetota bacterium]